MRQEPDERPEDSSSHIQVRICALAEGKKRKAVDTEWQTGGEVADDANQKPFLAQARICPYPQELR